MSPAQSRRTVGGGIALTLVVGVLTSAEPVARAAVPAVTADCQKVRTYTFDNPLDVVISDIGSVAASPITVADVPGAVLDVEVTTDLEHTYPGDIDMTVTSPEGTVVTLTTDNGSAYDNVFDGTVWSNYADPDGQVPYIGGANGGMVTDTAYTNGTAEPRLTPEESLGAFAGENPNGQWTLTISDDQDDDVGNLSGWSLRIRTRPDITVLTERIIKNRTAVAIPDTVAVVESTLDVTSAGAAIDRVKVTTKLQHSFADDIDMALTSPRGTVVTLTTDNGGNNSNVFNGTIWSDKANRGGQVPYVTNDGLVTDHLYADSVLASPLVPEEPLAAFAGEDPDGTWTLTISGGAGELTGWTLDIFSLSDTQVCRAKVRAKAKQKFKKKVALKVKAKAAEKATAVATGAVKIKGVKGKLALRKVKVKLVAGKAKTLTLRFAGSKKKVKRAQAKVKKALAKKKKVTARITVRLTDKRGNAKRIKRTVRVVR